MQITDDMVLRAAIAHHFASLQDAGLPPEELLATPQEEWDDARANDDGGKGEEESLRHMRAALQAALGD